jgi:hypothetical protein
MGLTVSADSGGCEGSIDETIFYSMRYNWARGHDY